MKKCLIVTLFIFLLIPICVSAKNTLKDIEPEVNIKGIDIEKYDVEKEVSNDSIIISIKEKDGKLSYSWTFNKKDIKDNKIDLNFEIKYVSPNKKIIDSLSKDNNDKFYIYFTHHGDIPSEARVNVFVGDKYKNNEKLYLYYYNAKDKDIEYIDKDLKVKDGYVSFKIRHCSDYFLTGAVVNNAKGNPKIITSIIIILSLFIFILLCIMLFSNN